MPNPPTNDTPLTALYGKCTCERRDCYYHTEVTGSCDYSFIHGKSRGCGADNCDKYRVGGREHRKALRVR